MKDSEMAGGFPASSGAAQEDPLFQTVLDSLTHPFYVIDVGSYRVRLANRAAARAHQAGPTTCHALTHKRDAPCEGPEHPCPLRIIQETKKPVVVEHAHYDGGGERHDVEVRAFPIFNKRRQVAQVIEYCVDVTEHKRIMARRQWELAVNKALVELADALIDPSFSIEEVATVTVDKARSLTGSQHGYVSSLDPDTGNMVAHTPTHIISMERSIHAEGPTAVLSPLPDGRYPALWGHALNTGRGFYTNAPAEHPAATDVPAGPVPLENFLAVPALVGDIVVGQIALANCENGYSDDDLDAVTRMAKLYALAVQRRRNEMALRASEERYALAQKAARIGSWDWNIVTGKLVWSERIEPMFGFPHGGFAGTYEAFLQSIHPDDRQFVIDSVNACVEQGNEYKIEHRIVWPDGAVRWVSETGDVIRDPSGKAVRMLGVVQDITERKRASDEIRRLNEQLEQRVLERTMELTEANEQLREEMDQRRRLESEILEISERERRRIGQELHDSLGQQLTGIAIMSKVLQQKLRQHSGDEAIRAGEITQLISQAIEETRRLSRGLHPVTLDESGLMSALQVLAMMTERTSGVSCTFQCDDPVPIANASTAVHLYRIAQEAVTNALRHGKPTWLRIGLQTDGDRAILSIENDGRAFPKTLPKTGGMGLQVMNYRAEGIGGTLNVQQGPAGGTRVTCTFALKSGQHDEERENAAEDTKKP